MLSQEAHHQSRVLDGHIACWEFFETADADSFKAAFDEFYELIHRDHIDALVVDVKMKDAWGKDIQELWLKTGELADEAGIKRWGVVTPNLSKKITIRHLVKGGKEGNRSYAYLISDSLDEILTWIRA